jgi:hypothetical protein
MIGDLGLGQEYGQKFLDLSQAQAGGEGDGGESLERGPIEEDPPLSVVKLFGDRQVELLILKAKPSDQSVRFGPLREPLLELSCVLVDSLATALGLVGLFRDRAMSAGEDGGGVADPGADR